MVSILNEMATMIPKYSFHLPRHFTCLAVLFLAASNLTFAVRITWQFQSDMDQNLLERTNKWEAEYEAPMAGEVGARGCFNFPDQFQQLPLIGVTIQEASFDTLLQAFEKQKLAVDNKQDKSFTPVLSPNFLKAVNDENGFQDLDTNIADKYISPIKKLTDEIANLDELQEEDLDMIATLNQSGDNAGISNNLRVG